MKKMVLFFAVLMMALSFSGCSNQNGESVCGDCGNSISIGSKFCSNCGAIVNANEKTIENEEIKNSDRRYAWDDVCLNSYIPEPESKQGDVQTNSLDDLYMIVEGTSFKEYEAYVNACVAMGYDIDVTNIDGEYEAFSADGCKLSLDYFSYDKAMHISLKRLVTGAFRWHELRFTELLPALESNEGNVYNNNNARCDLHIGGISKEQFADYIERCKDKGFVADNQEYENYYFAKHSDGYELTLEYYGCDVIYIEVYDPYWETRGEDVIAAENRADGVANGQDSNEPQIYNNSFNITDEGLLDWLNELSTAQFGYEDLGLFENTNTSYLVTMQDGTEGVLMLNHDSKNVSAIMTWFENWEDAAALAIWIGEKIDTSFSAEDAFLPIASDESYTAADMTVMRLNLAADFEVTVLAPSEYFVSILSKTGNAVDANSTKQPENVNCKDYDFGFASFSIPEYYIESSTSSEMIMFKHKDNENNRIGVIVEEIPSYMRIDTGGDSALVTKEDTAEYLIYSLEDDVLSEGWKTDRAVDYYEKYFTINNDDGSITYGRSIAIPININKKGIAIHAICEDKERLSDVDIVLNSMDF